MGKGHRAKSKKRIFIIFLIIFGCMLGLVGRLAYIQFAMAGKLQDLVLDQRLRDIPVEPKRGIIYDREKRELAVSASVDSIYAVPSEVKNPEETARHLAAELGMEEKDVYDKITRRRAFEWVKRKVEQNVGKKIRILIQEKKVTGIGITEESRRFYPKGMLAAHVIGFAGIDSQGLYGIEKSYDQELKGTPGKIKVERDGHNRVIPFAAQKYEPPSDGNNVYLTIDEVVQHIAEREAEKALDENSAKNVSIIIMQPKTGEILALVNKPSFDPNDYQKYDQSLWRNAAISDSYEPGSTFKVITTAAALEEKIANENTRFYCPGHIKIPGSTIKCWKAGGHGSQSLAEVVENSCNVGFVQLGLELGQEKFYQYVKNFGFGQKTDLDLIGEATGILIPESRLKSVDLARVAFGQSISVTPVQLVSAVSAVANGGQLLKPHIVRQITNSNGEVIKDLQPEPVKQVLTKAAADRTLTLLEQVVSQGTGKNAQVPGYLVGGKTGTAQKVIDGRYADGKYIASFIGVAPVDDPQIVVLVIIDEPSGGAYYGGQIAAPVAGSVMKDVLQYLSIKPNQPIPGDSNKTMDSSELGEEELVTVPSAINFFADDAGEVLTKAGFKVTLSGEGEVIWQQTPLPGARVPKGTEIILSLQPKIEPGANLVTVPDLTGLTMRDAAKVLADLGLLLHPQGTGVAVKQEVPPGTKVAIRSPITVFFEPPHQPDESGQVFRPNPLDENLY